MNAIDLNSDLGESYGHYVIGNDEQVLQHISSANIACGYHAGDHNVMMKTVKLAKAAKVRVGAHPGFHDLQGFGRREIKLSAAEIYNLVLYQIGALTSIAEAAGERLHHVKPHGALYNMAARDKEIARAIADATRAANPALILYGLAGSKLIEAGKEAGLIVANEVFADRTYQSDGSLTPRNHPNALIHNRDEAIKRVIQMIKTKKVQAVTGEDIPIETDTICVHGDEQHALEFVHQLKHQLEAEHIMIKPIDGGRDRE